MKSIVHCSQSIADRPQRHKANWEPKPMDYGLGMWFFRVLMGVVSNWMMFNVPAKTLVYVLFAGFMEMIILGIINGIMLKR